MAVQKCEMCGGSLEVEDNGGFAVCTYCGTRQALPESGSSPEAVKADALRIENEVAAIEAEAKKQVAAAKGRADAKKIEADGEAYYNRTVSASLTPALVNIKALDKWDGKTPIVSGGNGTFIDASKFVR